MAQDINDLGRDLLIISEIELPKNRIVTRINQQHQENQNDRETGLFQDLTVLPSNVLEWPRWLERSYQEAPEMQVRVETLRMRLLGLSYVKDEISVADVTKTNLEQKSENSASEHEVTATSENRDSRPKVSSSRQVRSLVLNAKADLELTPEIPVSPDAHGQDAQTIVPDDSSIPGSDFRATDRQLDPDNGLLQLEEPDPVTQEANSRSRSKQPVDNDRRDFRAKAAVPPKREQSRSGWKICFAVFGVLFGVFFFWN